VSSTLGDFLLLTGPDSPPAGLERLMRADLWPTAHASPDAVRLSSPAPGIHVWCRGEVRIQPGERGGLGLALEPLQGNSFRTATDPRSDSFAQWTRNGRWTHQAFRGRYAYVFWDTAAKIVAAYTDPFRTCSVFYAKAACGFLIASDLRLLLGSRLVEPTVSLDALYQYLNFSYIPAPLTAIKGASKLPAGHRLELKGGQISVQRYWDATYSADLDVPESERAEILRERLVGTVRSYRCGDAAGWGTFLSGGTDSSSISGILAKAHPATVNSFSMGFEEQGYDELQFSRIASDRYGLAAHEHRLNESEAVSSISRLATAFDEPFGNSSAIPTLHCAELAARHGVSLLMAGDGGDEIFGGNERYLKDKIFQAFHRAPAPARRLARWLAGGLKRYDSRFANRLKNFVHRGSLPNPERFYSDDSFASDCFEELLSDDFRAAVARGDALQVQKSIYEQAQADCDLHRLMYLDLKMTIADNDVVKVVRAAKLAGIQVAFPFLDRCLVEFSGQLPGRDKVRGLRKRHLFKLATQDILPQEIRNKKKQGFGLPVSVWLRRGGQYRELAHDVVTSDRATRRGYFKPGFVRQLLERHAKGGWDYSSEIHMLMMLELWHREYVDGHA
jgi:asparagine synthase (glutamine-hydrolysing)